jgi:hypothetical protein
MKAQTASAADIKYNGRPAAIWLAIIATLLAYGAWHVFFQTHGPVDVSGYYYDCYEGSQVTETSTPPMTSWNLAHADTAFFTNVVQVDPETGGTYSALTADQRERLALSTCRSNGRDAVETNLLWMVPLLCFGLWRARRTYLSSEKAKALARANVAEAASRARERIQAAAAKKAERDRVVNDLAERFAEEERKQMEPYGYMDQLKPYDDAEWGMEPYDENDADIEST